MAIRIARRQAAGNGASHGLVNEQTLAPELDERQRSEVLHPVA